MNPYTGPQSHAAMDFFQSLLKGSGMPSGFASWMAPTLDPEELDRKIVDLRVVLQWLEANARLTQATIQALEVQRMTLSTLKTMNVDMSDLAAHMGEAMRAGAQAMSAAAQPADGPRGPADAPAAQAASAPAPDAAGAEGGGAATGTSSEGPRIPGLLDPMQWWSAVSEQFSRVAADSLRDSPWPIPPSPSPSSGPDASAPARSRAASGDAPAAAPKRRSAPRSGAAKPAAGAASGSARKRTTGGSRGSR